MSLSTFGTLLVITPLSGNNAPVLTRYSSRGCTQTLDPISGTSSGGSVLGSWIHESTNAELMDWSYAPFRKLQSTITCIDTESPCLNKVWHGVTCLIDCVCERSYPSGGTPDRAVISGTEREQDGIIYYRPQITAMIIGIRNGLVEYRSDYSWQLDFRENKAP